MSEPSPHQPAFRDAAKEKGGSPEDARQGKTKMVNVLEARPAGNSERVDISTFNVDSDNRKAGLALNKLVAEAKAKGKATVQVTTLTPALAALLLDRNTENRRINQRLVDTFAIDIGGGRWSLNGEPIVISDTGELNDGQHRCQAVVDTGRSIETVMVIGVSRDSRSTLDQGRARSIGDYLGMDGHTDPVVLGATAGYLWSYRNRGRIYSGGVGKIGIATKGEVREIVRANPGLARSVAIAGSKAAAVGGRPLVAFCHFLFSGIDRAAGDEFFVALMDGAGLKAGHPILYARNRLINERGRLGRQEKAELLFKTWNAWRRGENVSRLLLVGSDVLPVLEA